MQVSYAAQFACAANGLPGKFGMLTSHVDSCDDYNSCRSKHCAFILLRVTELSQ